MEEYTQELYDLCIDLSIDPKFGALFGTDFLQKNRLLFLFKDWKEVQQEIDKDTINRFNVQSIYNYWEDVQRVNDSLFQITYPKTNVLLHVNVPNTEITTK
jgi:glutamine phosphoribosylpyrophosphate amidotransferase